MIQELDVLAKDIKKIRIWDALVWIFVILPVITGGVWYYSSKLKIELVDPEVTVIILVFVAFIWKVPLQKSWIFLILKKMGFCWKKNINKMPGLLWAATAGVSIVLGFASLRRHWAIHSSAFDLGIFTNTIWNLTHGGGYISSLKGGLNLFTDHQSPLFWLLVPFFTLLPRPETLLVLQAIGLAVGGPATYWLGRQYGLGQRSAILPLLYWGYLPMRDANLFDFHPEVFMLPLFLWAIVVAHKKSFWSVPLFLAALGAKESAPAVACGIGLAWMFGAAPRGMKKMGVMLCIFSMVLFVFDTQWVPRHFGAQDYAYMSHYSDLGHNVFEIILSPFIYPKLFIDRFFGLAQFRFFFGTLAPLGLLPLLGWPAFLAAIPGYCIMFLSHSKLVFGFHYGIECSVGLFWALAPALKRWFSLPWIIFWFFAFIGRSEMYAIRYHTPDTHAVWFRQVFLPCVDPQLSIVASDALVPHLSTRHWIGVLPHFEIPGSWAACVIVDTAFANWPLGIENVKKLQFEGYTREYSCGSLTVLHRDASCLRCQPQCDDGS